ncbi:MAG: sporulation initiation factor Spo0A C-terminal domain-containing protein [Eubacteriales bacterium]|nr:sporulation initiation factor Spo0A C-terminal domain-containing protein [Eubacteriales bacterium]
MKPLFHAVLFMARHLDACNISSAVKFIMIMLNMPSEKAGYKTLIITIPVYSDDREQSMTKELYPKIGRKLGITWKKVEKDIRDVIKKAGAAEMMKFGGRFFLRIKRHRISSLLQELQMCWNCGRLLRRLRRPGYRNKKGL